jgi:putative ABC transport system permease protein
VTTTREPLSLASPDLRLLRQIVVVARIGLSTLRQRIKGGLLIVASVGCMVFVLLSVLSMGEGIRAGLLEGADPSRVVLRRQSTAWLHVTRLPDGVAALAAATPGVAHASDGTPLAEAAIYGIVGGLTKRSNGESGSTSFVGVGPHWTEMTPDFRLLTGRMPQPGARELIAGPRALRKFSSLDSGFVQYRDQTWRLVGTFTTGSWWDGFLVGPAADLREHAGLLWDSAVLVRLTSPQAFESFRQALASRLPAGVVIEREPDFYANYWRSLPKNAIYLAVLLAMVFGTGALASLAHVMHAVMQERRREIATLRVLGFSGAAVAASLVLEAMLFATLGALTGTSLAWIAMDGFLFNGAWTVFEVTVNLHLLFIGTGLAIAIALLGTLPLAFRTLRTREMEVLQSLRELDQAVLASACRRPCPSAEPGLAALVASARLAPHFVGAPQE